MSRWDVIRKFTLDKELSLAADSHLTKNQVRRSATGEWTCYIQYGIIEAENPDLAAEIARNRMDALLAPYDVEYNVFEMHVTLIRTT